jgi:O-antigen/teichoic acid export membrane protein
MISPGTRRDITQIFKGERNRRVAMAAAAGVAQRSVAVVGTFLMFPQVLHALGTNQFGLWGAATSLSMLVAVADFGVGSAILTLVAHAVAAEEYDTPREYFTAALVMACAIAVVLACGGMLAVFFLAPASQQPIYLVAVIGVAINVPLGSAQSAWQALQRGWVSASWDLVQTLFLIAGLVMAVRWTSDLRVYVLVVYAALLSASALNMASLLIIHPELRPVSWTASIGRLKTVTSTGLRYFILSVFDALSYLLDNVIALQLLGAAASAKMLIAQRICVAAVGMLMVVAQPLWPAFVDAAARGDRHWIYRALARGSLLVTGAAVAGSSIVVLFGSALLKLWLKTNIGIDQSMLWIMALWIVSLSLVRVQILLLNALRIMQFQIVIFTVATLISVVLKFLLAPKFGIAGILFATAATFPIIILPAMLWRIARWRKTLEPDRRPGSSNTGHQRERPGQ